MDVLVSTFLELSAWTLTPGSHIPCLLSPIPCLLRRKQEVLEETSLEKRLRRVLELVREQTRVLSIASKIHSEVEGKLNSRHREYYLRQQLKAIRSELGEEVTVTVKLSPSQPYVTTRFVCCSLSVFAFAFVVARS